MAKLSVPGTAGFNAGKSYMSRPLRVTDIVIDPEISRIFKICDKTFEEIQEKIKKFGYDKSQPVVVWKGRNILVDGHTRLAAAKEAGLDEIPAAEMEFESHEEALMYTFERQVMRRNLTGDEILTATRMLYNGPRAAKGTGSAAENLAKRLGVGSATVSRAKKILKEAPAEEIEAIRRGEKTIGETYKAMTRKARRPEPAGAGETNVPLSVREKEAGFEKTFDNETAERYALAAQGKIIAARNLITNRESHPAFIEDSLSLLEEALECLGRMMSKVSDDIL